MGRVALAVVLALGVVACGGNGESDGDDDDDDDVGPAPIPTARYLDELTPAEQRELCEWAIAAQGGPGMYQCTGETSVTVDSVDECAVQDLSGIHCRVSLLESCLESLNGTPCRLLSSQACSPYLDCVLNIN